MRGRASRVYFEEVLSSGCEVVDSGERAAAGRAVACGVGWGLPVEDSLSGEAVVGARLNRCLGGELAAQLVNSLAAFGVGGEACAGAPTGMQHGGVVSPAKLAADRRQ